MLYSLLAVVIVEAVAIPVVGLYCFKAGFNLSARGEERPVIPPIKRAKPEPVSDEEARIGALLLNIESYDGTDAGQRDIK
jgi:hypothetical protein